MRVLSTTAEMVEFCFFQDGAERRTPLQREGDWWWGLVQGIGAGVRYGFRTRGPWDPSRHLFHHPDLLLVDPHARSLSGDFVDHPSVHAEGPRSDTAPYVPRGVVMGAVPPPRPGPGVAWEDTVIYETHIRHLTMGHPAVPPSLRGTYLGAAHPAVIDHLVGLGVTTVELMPVAHHVTEPFLQQQGRRNVWGYSTLGWFAPHSGYATGTDGRQVTEFAAMVDSYHAAGLEVVVDVVFNHTAEGGDEGVILGMKGLDPGWYRYDERGYVDWTGTGNTVDTASSRVREAIVAALHWWSQTLGVDGFRFDLGVTLGRGETDFDPGQLAWLTDDPVLAELKLIAEPWDLGPHGYRLGEFGPGWREWNARFRDDVRDFWRGRSDATTLANRLAGSPDLFGDRSPGAAIDFVTAHDGFTLTDLVSYDRKDNRDNGEDGEDGHDDNRSWNSGVEGPSDDPVVTDRRRRRASALLATLFLTRGVPMLLGGDELGRSQGGNNNAYALDGPRVWYDWDHPTRVGLVTALIDCRRRLLGRGGRVTVLDSGTGGTLRLEMEGRTGPLLLVLNPTDEPGAVELSGGGWRLEFDTAEGDGRPTQPPAAALAPWSLRLYSTVAPLGIATTPSSDTV